MASATLFSYAGGGSKRVGQAGYSARESRIGRVLSKREQDRQGTQQETLA